MVLIVIIVVGASTLYYSYIQEFLGNSLTLWHGSSNSSPRINNSSSTSSSRSINTILSGHLTSYGENELSPHDVLSHHSVKFIFIV